MARDVATNLRAGRVMFGPYLLTRNPYSSLASTTRRFWKIEIEALWHRLGNLLMSLDMWRLHGDRRSEIPVLDYDIVTRAAAS